MYNIKIAREFWFNVSLITLRVIELIDRHVCECVASQVLWFQVLVENGSIPGFQLINEARNHILQV